MISFILEAPKSYRVRKCSCDVLRCTLPTPSDFQVRCDFPERNPHTEVMNNSEVPAECELPLFEPAEFTAASSSNTCLQRPAIQI